MSETQVYIVTMGPTNKDVPFAVLKPMKEPWRGANPKKLRVIKKRN